MSDFETIRAITDNLHEALGKAGIHFSRKAYDDEKSLPASLFPFGRIFYLGEAFEHPHNQRPLYSHAEFRVTVQLLLPDQAEMMAEQQRWVHLIRGALTIEALNVNGLSSSRLVSRVNIPKIEVENQKNRSSIQCRASIRYRES